MEIQRGAPSRTVTIVFCVLSALCFGLHLAEGVENVTTITNRSTRGQREGSTQGVIAAAAVTTNTPNGAIVVVKATEGATEYTTDWTPVSIDDLISNKGLVTYYKINTGFLSAVQPRIITAIEKYFDFSDAEKTAKNFRENWQEIVKYLLGFAICAGIGVLLLLCVPFTGFIICCCRCCDKCGGKVHPRDRQTSDCARCCCGFLLFACLAFVLTGGIVMVLVSTDINQRLTGESSVFDEAAVSFNTLASYADNSMAELRASTLNQYQEATKDVFIQLDDIIPQVQDIINATAHLQSLKTFSESFTPMKSNAEAVTNSASNYISNRTDLNQQLDNTRTNVSGLLAACSGTSLSCSAANDALNNLEFVANFSDINLTNFIKVIGEAENENISGVVNSGIEMYYKAFEDANTTLQTETNKAKEKSKEAEASIERLLNDVGKTLNGTALKAISEDIANVKKSLAEDRVYLRIPFWALLGLAVLVLLTVVCYYIGLLYGFFGNRADVKNTKCCSWKTGACWMIGGLSLTYIFYFFLMLVLLVVFLTGGATHTEVCRHLYNLPKSDARHFIDRTIQSVINQNNITFTLSETYLDCANNESVYKALKLEENGVNITSVINMDEINNAIDSIKDVNVTINSVTFLTRQVKDALNKLGGEMEKVSANIDTWIEETKKEVVNRSFTSVAALLDQAASDTTSPDEIQNAAQELRDYDAKAEELKDIKSRLATQLKSLQVQTSQNVTAIIEGLSAAETRLNTNGSTLVKVVLTGTAGNVKRTINTTVETIKIDVQTIGRCRPVYDALSGMINTGCVQTLYPINAYAFSLGMVLIFLLPAILCAFKLVTLYRKIKPYSSIEDREDNDLYMAYQDSPPYNGSKETHNDMLLHRVDRPKSDYVAMADNPVFLDDEHHMGQQAYQIPRAVLRQGTRVLPVQPAMPDDRYFYAMPARGSREAMGPREQEYRGQRGYMSPQEPPPSYSYNSRSQV